MSGASAYESGQGVSPDTIFSVNIAMLGIPYVPTHQSIYVFSYVNFLKYPQLSSILDWSTPIYGNPHMCFYVRIRWWFSFPLLLWIISPLIETATSYQWPCSSGNMPQPACRMWEKREKRPCFTQNEQHIVPQNMACTSCNLMNVYNIYIYCQFI